MSMRRRVTLFVGGLLTQGLPEALASGADLVCLDLEDAVPPERKAEARAAVCAVLRDAVVPPRVRMVVRVNDVPSADGRADLGALVACGRPPAIVMLPKVHGPEEVVEAGRFVAAAGADCELAAIIETAHGLESAGAVARAHPRLRSLYFGGFDLSSALGCQMAWEPLLYARSRVVHAAALAGIEALDSPYAGVGDDEALAADCERAKSLGMAGKCTKHAAQVPVIRRAFSATVAEIERARRIVSLFRADPTRPLVVEGRLIELPAIRRLERLAAQEPED
jgi:citrate lyase beta subunit